MSKIGKQYAGGAVDESLSELAIKTIREIAPGDDALVAEIGLQLGRYRSYLLERETTPQDAAVVAHLQHLKEQALELREGIDLLPSAAEAWAHEKSTAAWGYDLSRTLNRELIRFSALMGAVGDKYKPHLGRAGKKTRNLEHSLLAEIAGLLEKIIKRKEASAWWAAQILTAAGVHGMPSSEKKAADAVRIWRKNKTP